MFLINIVHARAGGGLRQAKEFVASLPHLDRRPPLQLHVSREMVPHMPKGMAYIEVRNPLGVWRAARGLKPTAVVTLFGVGLPLCPVPQIVGCAYSHLLFPDISFWADYPRGTRLRKEFRDSLRRNSFRFAAGSFVETEELRMRAVKEFGIEDSLVRVVPPSRPSIPQQLKREDSVPGRIVYVGSANRNKGFHLIPEIAQQMLRLAGDRNWHFRLTLDPNAPVVGEVFRRAKAYGVEDRLEFIGPVGSDTLEREYRECSAVILLSRLESFSNTILEAWAHERPLIVADEPWARGICGDAAEYATRSDSLACASACLRVVHDPVLQRRLVTSGIRQLSTFPGAVERTGAILDFAAYCAKAVRE